MLVHADRGLLKSSRDALIQRPGSFRGAPLIKQIAQLLVLHELRIGITHYYCFKSSCRRDDCALRPLKCNSFTANSEILAEPPAQLITRPKQPRFHCV